MWSFLALLYPIIFYCYFVNPSYANRLWHPRVAKILLGLIILTAVTIALHIFNNAWLHILYFYMIFGTVTIGIPTVLLMYHQQENNKIIFVSCYFFLLSLLYEITALKQGWWSFPGPDFIGLVSIAGVQFPLEELIFWMVLLTPAVLAWYTFMTKPIRSTDTFKSRK